MHSQSFTENFNTNTGLSTSISSILSGVQFNFIFESTGDGGDMAWEYLQNCFGTN